MCILDGFRSKSADRKEQTDCMLFLSFYTEQTSLLETIKMVSTEPHHQTSSLTENNGGHFFPSSSSACSTQLLLPRYGFPTQYAGKKIDLAFALSEIVLGFNEFMHFELR